MEGTGGAGNAPDKDKGNAGAGAGQGTDLTAKVAELEAAMTALQRDKLQLEKDLSKERGERNKRDQAAQQATERAAATQKAAIDALKAAGIEIPGQDPASEAAQKLRQIEDEKRKAADKDREDRIARLTIERELLKAMAGKADDSDYALYRALRTEAFSKIAVEGDKVSGIEAVVEELTKAGVLKAAQADGDKSKKAPGTGGQPPLQGDKHPWREAKTWQDFVKLPWATQQQAEKDDPTFVEELRKKFNAT